MVAHQSAELFPVGVSTADEGGRCSVKLRKCLKEFSDCVGALNSLMSAISGNSLPLIHQISGAAHLRSGAAGNPRD